METAPRNWDQFALLLVDMQRDFWSEKRAQKFPDFAENIRRLLHLCRNEGIEVIHLRAGFEPDGSDWMPNNRLVGRTPCVRGTDGIKTLPFARETGGEAVIIKTTYDGFHCPDLLPYLRERGKRFLLTAVVEDCCADDPQAHKRTLDRYGFAFERTEVRRIPKRHSKWNAKLEKLGSGGRAA
jgi:nicotinamidase-related amidase